LNSTTKNKIFKILSDVKIGSLFSSKFGGIGTILFMHKVVPQHITLAERIPMMRDNEIAADQLEELLLFFRNKNYDIISLNELHELLQNDEKPKKKFVVFTFDDGYEDNLTLAYPIFKKHNAPFALYVTNCFPNKTAHLWWNLLETILLENEQVSLSVSDIELELTTQTLEEKEKAFEILRDQCIHNPPEVLQKIIQFLTKKYQKAIHQYVEHEAISWEQLKQLAKDPLVTIGAHTYNHFALNELSQEEVKKEIITSKEELEKKLEIPIEHFAYPYGSKNEITQREVQLLKEAVHFKTATTTRAGNIFLEHKSDLLSLPRVQILGGWTDHNALNLNLQGLIPALKNGFKSKVTL